MQDKQQAEGETTFQANPDVKTKANKTLKREMLMTYSSFHCTVYKNLAKDILLFL